MLIGRHYTPIQLSSKFVFTWNLNWVFDIIRDVQFKGKKDLSNCHCWMSFQQRPCNWMSSPKTVSWTQRLVCDLLCELTCVFSLLFS